MIDMIKFQFRLNKEIKTFLLKKRDTINFVCTYLKHFFSLTHELLLCATLVNNITI